MSYQKENTSIPTYITDKRQLVQIIEQVVDGKKVERSIPLKAYQTIQIPSKS